MIRHCAFLRFRPGICPAEIDEILDGFVRPDPKQAGFADMRAGENISPEGLDCGFSHGLTTGFNSSQLLQSYLDRPDHLALAERIAAMLDDEIAGGVMFVDGSFEVLNTKTDKPYSMAAFLL